MVRGRARNRVRVVAALAALAAFSACGTRLPDEAFVGTGAEGDLSAGAGAGGPAVAAAGATTTTAPAGGGGAAPGAPSQVAVVIPAAGGAGGGGGGDRRPVGGAAGPNQASDVGVTETTIRIGTIVAENGVLGDAFAPAVRGLRAWAEWINAQGGIGGRTVELFTCDDREDRARSLECARRLVEQDQVFALVATNTRAMGGAAPVPERAGHAGASASRSPTASTGTRTSAASTAAGYPRDGTTVGHNGDSCSHGLYRWFRENLGVTRPRSSSTTSPSRARPATSSRRA